MTGHVDDTDNLFDPLIEFEIKAYRVVTLPTDMRQHFGCTHGVLVEDELDVLLDQAQAANANAVLRAVEGDCVALLEDERIRGAR